MERCGAVWSGVVGCEGVLGSGVARRGVEGCGGVWKGVEGCGGVWRDVSLTLSLCLGFAGVFDRTRELDEDLIRKAQEEI